MRIKGKGGLAELIGFASHLLQHHMLPPSFIPFHTSLILYEKNMHFRPTLVGIRMYSKPCQPHGTPTENKKSASPAANVDMILSVSIQARIRLGSQNLLAQSSGKSWRVTSSREWTTPLSREGLWTKFIFLSQATASFNYR